jgi:hypothetical protein
MVVKGERGKVKGGRRGFLNYSIKKAVCSLSTNCSNNIANTHINPISPFPFHLSPQ